MVLSGCSWFQRVLIVSGLQSSSCSFFRIYFSRSGCSRIFLRYILQYFLLWYRFIRAFFGMYSFSQVSLLSTEFLLISREMVEASLVSAKAIFLSEYPLERRIAISSCSDSESWTKDLLWGIFWVHWVIWIDCIYTKIEGVNIVPLESECCNWKVNLGMLHQVPFSLHL